MKTIYLLLAVAAFAAPAISNAATSSKKCAFGESTGDLKDELDSNASGKQWYESEHISLSSAQRLQGLTQVEKKMIQYATGGTGPLQRDLEEFVSSDGYITYFSHNSNGREFALVASYPGDNEYGSVVEIKTSRRGSRDGMRVIGTAAVVTDGDFENCKVN